MGATAFTDQGNRKEKACKKEESIYGSAIANYHNWSDDTELASKLLGLFEIDGGLLSCLYPLGKTAQPQRLLFES